MLKLSDSESGAEENARYLEEKLGAGVWSWDLTTGEIHWSTGIFDLLGLAPGSVAPSFALMEQATHPDDRRPQAITERLLRDGVSLDREFRIVRPNGSLRWVESRTEVRHDSNGNPRKAFGVALDVTPHRERSLNFSILASRFETLAGLTDDFVWVADLKGDTIELQGVSQSDRSSSMKFTGPGWIELVHPEDRAMTQERWRGCVETGEPFLIEHRLLMPGSVSRWTRTAAKLITDGNGRPLEWLGISTNVDLQKISPIGTGAGTLLSGAQIRGARGILVWAVRDLAAAANVSPATIRRLEEFDGVSRADEPSLLLIQAALTDAGIEFFFPAIGAPGLRKKG